jgi:hypothetical protein
MIIQLLPSSTRWGGARNIRDHARKQDPDTYAATIFAYCKDLQFLEYFPDFEKK